MYEFDKRLRALAGCAVVEDEGGAMVFSPNPVIVAENDPILAHEICHVLAGREDYEVFASAVEVRKENEVFRHVLNMLYDWYHEYLYGKYSGFLWSTLNKLHETYGNAEITGIQSLDDINTMYLDRGVEPSSVSVRDVIDLVAWADRLFETIIKEAQAIGIGLGDLVALLESKDIGILGGRGKIIVLNPDGSDEKGNHRSKLGGPKSDIGMIPEKSNYYITAISKYYHAIQDLANMWKRNKYSWINNYYGEINWKNLQGMFQGEMMNLPVWRLFQKIGISRKVYLAIDRSGSTSGIDHLIMDTAIIIAESLRTLGIPISILDIGVTDSIVNSIDDPLDISWFTPRGKGGTPMGEVCSMIKKADHDSYLLIVTDGEPDNWDTLLSALHAFPGSNLTFVIGESYGKYAKYVKNAIHVEPHTIIREMLHDSTLE